MQVWGGCRDGVGAGVCMGDVCRCGAGMGCVRVWGVYGCGVGAGVGAGDGCVHSTD